MWRVTAWYAVRLGTSGGDEAILDAFLSENLRLNIIEQDRANNVSLKFTLSMTVLKLLTLLVEIRLGRC